MATRNARTARATAKQASKAKSKAPAAPSNGPTIKVDLQAEAAVKALKRESARGRTVALASKFDGKPLAAFKQAWEDQALVIHGESSKFTQRQQPQAFSGWLSWLTRNGIVKVVR